MPRGEGTGLLQTQQRFARIAGLEQNQRQVVNGIGLPRLDLHRDLQFSLALPPLLLTEQCQRQLVVAGE